MFGFYPQFYGTQGKGHSREIYPLNLYISTQLYEMSNVTLELNFIRIVELFDSKATTNRTDLRIYLLNQIRKQTIEKIVHSSTSSHQVFPEI